MIPFAAEFLEELDISHQRVAMKLPAGMLELDAPLSKDEKERQEKQGLKRSREMKFEIVTIFPDFFRGPLDYGIVRKAREAGLIEILLHDLREVSMMGQASHGG